MRRISKLSCPERAIADPLAEFGLHFWSQDWVTLHGEKMKRVSKKRATPLSRAAQILRCRGSGGNQREAAPDQVSIRQEELVLPVPVGLPLATLIPPSWLLGVIMR